jgi:hypothetical protein
MPCIYTAGRAWIDRCPALYGQPRTLFQTRDTSDFLAAGAIANPPPRESIPPERITIVTREDTQQKRHCRGPGLAALPWSGDHGLLGPWHAFSSPVGRR